MSTTTTTNRLDRERIQRIAWMTIIIATTIACMLTSTGLYIVWSYRTNAMVPHTALLIVRGSAEWVKWQRKGHTIQEQARNEQPIDEGEQIHIAESVGYGQVATLRLFDQSTIDMWAGADVLLKTMQTSRWNNREQVVVVQQSQGYARYDIHQGQPYEHVTYRVEFEQGWVELAPGGSYSVDFVYSERQIHTVDMPRPFVPRVIDVAVRAGTAVVQYKEQVLTLHAGKRIVLNPIRTNLLAPMDATWQLVRDGNFSLYSEEEYNNTTIMQEPTLPRARTWHVFSGSSQLQSSLQSRGFFRISHSCMPQAHATTNDCQPEAQQTAAWFIRSGGQTTNFTTGVIQYLGDEQQGIDIAEYRSLIFSVWVRVLNQSLALTGERGTECPIMIRFVTKQKQPTDPEEERVVCVYTSDSPAIMPERTPGIVYHWVQPYEWYHLTIELRSAEWLPNARYMRSIEIYANGHDYDSRATEVSLVGSQ